jgi:hypothetical protein
MKETDTTVTSWSFEVLDSSIFELEDAERILRFISFFDNLQHATTINACDSERAICVINCLAKKEYLNWKNDYGHTKLQLQQDIVCLCFYVLCY